MTQFIEGLDRQQTMLLPEYLDDYVDENSLVRAIDGSRFKALNAKAKNYTRGKLCQKLGEIDKAIERYLGELDRADEGRCQQTVLVRGREASSSLRTSR